MRGACSTHLGNEKCLEKFDRKNLPANRSIVRVSLGWQYCDDILIAEISYCRIVVSLENN